MSDVVTDLAFVLALAFSVTACGGAGEEFSPGDGPLESVSSPLWSITKSFGPVGDYESQYSPNVIKQPGWQSTLIYYCKNTPINGVYKDRVWRIEAWDTNPNVWVNDQMVIEGAGDSYLSCSPGTLVDSYGNFNMFYIGAPNNVGHQPLRVFQAWGAAPGTSFSQLGVVDNIPARYCSGCLETPSPIERTGGLWLYLVEDGYLVRWELIWSTSLHKWVAVTGSRVTVSNNLAATHGHVRKIGSTYYYVYSRADVPGQPPTKLYGIASADPGNFFGSPTLLQQAPGDDTVWYGRRIWSPDVTQVGTQFKVFFAGNKGTPPAWWGSATSIGYGLY